MIVRQSIEERERSRELRRAVRERLVRSRDLDALLASPPELRAREIRELVLDVDPLLSAVEHERLVHELAHEVGGLGVLEDVLADPEVTEVMINGEAGCFVERWGRIEQIGLVLTEHDIRLIVERVVSPLGLRFDRASPMVDARLADGSRLHAVMPPISVDGTCVTIRRFVLRDADLADFDATGEAAELVRWSVAAGWNLLISGGTGSGKSTLLQALARLTPEGERVVTIEETAELTLRLPHVVRLEARPPNAEGAGGVTVRELVRSALRMRPDRLIVGEIRGGEALDLLQALNTGHDGSLSTVHASTPGGAVERVLALAHFARSGVPHEALVRQLSAAVDAVVHVARGPDGARRIISLSEVRGDGPSVGTVPLLERSDGGLRVVGDPMRAARRFSTGSCPEPRVESHPASAQ